MRSEMYIAPPGAGKTTLKRKYPGVFIDPEESIDWKRMSRLHGLYRKDARLCYKGALLEHELDWPSVWIEEVLPRLRVAMLLEKQIIMGLITPSNVELVSRFLEAFRDQTTLLLPDEERHFHQLWHDETRRPKTWGPELRGWQHTFWIRLLLQGLAANLGLPVTQKAPMPKKRKMRRSAGLAAREARVGKRMFIEALFGRWAEVDAKEEIVAMCLEAKSDARGIQLACDRTAKACRKGLHDCKKTILLLKDVRGHALASWIAQDKVRPLARRRKNAVVFFAGTLAPLHHGHLDALNAAKAHLESKGWNVIGGYVSPFSHLKEDRTGALHSVLSSVRHRSHMVQLGVMSSDWIMADFPIEHVLRASSLEQGRHPAQLVVKRLRACGVLPSAGAVTTFWVNGKDAYLDKDFFGQFAQHADRDLLNPLRMLIIDNRDGKDAWSKDRIATEAPSLLPYVARHRVSTKTTSATLVRKALMDGHRTALKEAVGLPLVEAYLLGLMHTHAW